MLYELGLEVLINYKHRNAISIMDRARMASLPIPKGAIEIKISERDWGIERSYKTKKGTEICTPATFYSSR